MRLAPVIHAKCNEKQKGFLCNVLYVVLGTLTRYITDALSRSSCYCSFRLLTEFNYICERPFMPDAVMVMSPSTPLRSSSRCLELRIMQIAAASLAGLLGLSVANLQTAKSIAINRLTIARLTTAFISDLAFTSSLCPTRPAFQACFLSQMWHVTTNQ